MDTLKTKDFYLGSALLASNCKLIKLEPEGNFYWFVFADSDRCRRLSDAYWANELEVLAKSYAEAIRSLKDRLFANK